jgi:hypothetical protein
MSRLVTLTWMADWQEQPSRMAWARGRLGSVAADRVVATRRPGMARSPALQTAMRALAASAARARRWSLGVGALEALMAAGLPRGWNLEDWRMTIW